MQIVSESIPGRRRRGEGVQRPLLWRLSLAGIVLALVGRGTAWAQSADTAAASHAAPRFEWARPTAQVWFNAQRPYSQNDSAVWAGAGLTASVSAGATGRIGPFSFALRPLAFWTQNRAYTPATGLARPTSSYANRFYPGFIDYPYRFGDRPYARLDAGESWLRLDTRWIVAGLSNATQEWGPMHIYPLLLGPNAGGFPHVLFGTGRPWNVGIGRLGARAAVGTLNGSGFAADSVSNEKRLAAELFVVFSPAGMRGLELGGGRFFHRQWPRDGLRLDVLTIPFEALLKNRLPSKDLATSVADNQLLSVYARYAPPEGTVEVYGEFLRDDHSYDVLDLVREPDHESAWAMGMRRRWLPRTDGAPLTVLTLEASNGRISSLVRLREQTAVYVHSRVTAGHTERGQLLGSPAVFGGSGLAIDLTRRGLRRGWGLRLQSEAIAQNEQGGTWYGTRLGFYAGEASRIFTSGAIEYTVALGGQAGWNAQSAADNVTLRLAVRPASRATKTVK